MPAGCQKARDARARAQNRTGTGGWERRKRGRVPVQEHTHTVPLDGVKTHALMIPMIPSLRFHQGGAAGAVAAGAGAALAGAALAGAVGTSQAQSRGCCNNDNYKCVTCGRWNEVALSGNHSATCGQCGSPNWVIGTGAGLSSGYDANSYDNNYRYDNTYDGGNGNYGGGDGDGGGDGGGGGGGDGGGDGGGGGGGEG